MYSFDKEITDGKVYNLGESKTRSRRRWAELYAKTTGWSFEFHILPEELIRKDRDFRNAPPRHLLTDSSLYKRETGFAEPFSIEEAIKRTFSYAKENPECLGERANYKEEQQLVEKYYAAIDSFY